MPFLPPPPPLHRQTFKDRLKKLPLLVAIKRFVWRMLFSPSDNSIPELRDMVLYQQTRQHQLNHPNPLNRFGKQCFSQTDEDGITLEILRRIGKLDNGVYAEFGVGNGMENNTLILAAMGWTGFWVGGEKLVIATGGHPQRFSYLRDWVTLDNVLQLAQQGLENIGQSRLDVVSLDLDGNDIYFVEKLLGGGVLPQLFIVEYNGKFPPPVKWRMAYDARHTWQLDDYFGASLCSYVELFMKFGYRLVCCNSHTGANAFFVSDTLAGKFSDVPADIGEIYVEPRYQLYTKFGHAKSVRTIDQIFTD